MDGGLVFYSILFYFISFHFVFMTPDACRAAPRVGGLHAILF
jgi:hypothetical protein